MLTSKKRKEKGEMETVGQISGEEKRVFSGRVSEQSDNYYRGLSESCLNSVGEKKKQIRLSFFGLISPPTQRNKENCSPTPPGTKNQS